MLGIYVVFSIISPVIGKVTQNNFEISSIINMDIYAKELGTYEELSKNRSLEYTNNENIKQMYISKLKEDIVSKLKNRGYIVKKIELNIEDGENYSIKDITIYLDSKKQKEEKENNTINEIEVVNISVQNKEENKIENIESNVTHFEKTEIIKYIAEEYGIDEKKITIY